MRFLTSSLSWAVTALAYLTNTKPTNNPSEVAVKSAEQIPLQADSIYNNLSNVLYQVNVTAVPLSTCMVDMLRAGRADHWNYPMVADEDLQGPPWHRDHFLELRYFRDALIADTGISIATFYKVVEYANSDNNVFLVSEAVNMYKAGVPIANWHNDPLIKSYLCSEIVGGPQNVWVWDRVSTVLGAMKGDLDPTVRAVGDYLINKLNIPFIQCP
ncbi:hypothetical protein L218DRAFT_1016127 [Marasmius fiardii PR-910]|nr:hypothetical protein L218DRAFT_1016127 [Marasmius fiardii PR-910]